MGPVDSIKFYCGFNRLTNNQLAHLCACCNVAEVDFVF